MEKIHHLKHTKETLFFCISRLLEKTSFYGLRSILLLYMVTGALKIPEASASIIYGWFASSFVVSQIIGALFGDLLLGNKKAIIIGGIIQSLGCFSLCIPSTIGLYIGLSLVVFGTGLYSPNLIASFGKSYLNKSKLLDSAFTLLLLTADIGAFLGALLLSLLAFKFNFTIAFLLVGLLFLISVIPIFFIKENKTIENKQNQISTRNRILILTFIIVLIGIFCGVDEITDFKRSFLKNYFSVNDFNDIIFQNIHLIFSLVFSVIAIIVWSYYYSSSFLKLLIGFTLGLIALILLYSIPIKISEDKNVFVFVTFLIFQAISEIYIHSVTFSILTKYSNPKYLTIFISLSYLITTFSTMNFFWLSHDLRTYSNLGLIIGNVAYIIVCLSLIILLFNKKFKSLTDV